MTQRYADEDDTGSRICSKASEVSATLTALTPLHFSFYFNNRRLPADLPARGGEDDQGRFRGRLAPNPRGSMGGGEFVFVEQNLLVKQQLRSYESFANDQIDKIFEDQGEIEL
jgi:hypothetical protein